jgi:hypothetical protein
MELSARDALSRFGRKTPVNEKLIFLAIDNASITVDAEEDLRALFGISDDGTPEARALRNDERRLAVAAFRLRADPRPAGRRGAKGVIFDLNFPTASERR